MSIEIYASCHLRGCPHRNMALQLIFKSMDMSHAVHLQYVAYELWHQLYASVFAEMCSHFYDHVYVLFEEISRLFQCHLLTAASRLDEKKWYHSKLHC